MLSNVKAFKTFKTVISLSRSGHPSKFTPWSDISMLRKTPQELHFRLYKPPKMTCLEGISSSLWKTTWQLGLSCHVASEQNTKLLEKCPLDG